MSIPTDLTFSLAATATAYYLRTTRSDRHRYSASLVARLVTDGPTTPLTHLDAETRERLRNTITASIVFAHDTSSRQFQTEVSSLLYASTDVIVRELRALAFSVASYYPAPKPVVYHVDEVYGGVPDPGRSTFSDPVEAGDYIRSLIELQGANDEDGRAFDAPPAGTPITAYPSFLWLDGSDVGEVRWEADTPFVPEGYVLVPDSFLTDLRDQGVVDDLLDSYGL